MRQIASLFSVDNTTNKDMELSEIWRKDKEEYEKLYKRWGSLTGEIDGLNKKIEVVRNWGGGIRREYQGGWQRGSNPAICDCGSRQLELY